ncbi:aspartyl-phosphate phosphatase Spo0E family protein [Paenibacillus taichungensis]|uniref:Aspartyl-phosphate phosphatase Spo0E family protein n=1 Tax=Paenibacillus taichungensis TaxID=484184 RepID=A0A329R451_9BACL|nr:aspartyl-phosphate phosphatase Spo0E family protein [Paenibacillus taichungensis]RAW19324.1 aspartyl-phosphate phosphatase Spo0E family protein [Paenibacillus taichungensis]
MSRLLDLLEDERRKLNQLGEASLKQAIPLWENPEVQEQSRRVDELVARVSELRAKHSRVVR